MRETGGSSRCVVAESSTNRTSDAGEAGNVHSSSTPRARSRRRSFGRDAGAVMKVDHDSTSSAQVVAVASRATVSVISGTMNLGRLLQADHRLS